MYKTDFVSSLSLSTPVRSLLVVRRWMSLFARPDSLTRATRFARSPVRHVVVKIAHTLSTLGQPRLGPIARCVPLCLVCVRVVVIFLPLRCRVLCPPVETSHGAARGHPGRVLLAVGLVHSVGLMPAVVVVSVPAATATATASAVSVIVTVVSPAATSTGHRATLAGRELPQFVVPVGKVAPVAETAFSVFPPAKSRGRVVRSREEES